MCVFALELHVCFSCSTCWLSTQGGFLTHLKCAEICLHVLLHSFPRHPSRWGFAEIWQTLQSKIQSEHVDVVYTPFFFFMLFFPAPMKPPPSQRAVAPAPSDRLPPPASRNFCTSCFPGFGCDVWSWGERSQGPGALELASTGPPAPLPLSLPLLIWRGVSTFCSIVLPMNNVLC